MSRNSQPSEKSESMLTISQQHATYLYPVPAESNPRLPIVFIYIPFHALGLPNYDMIYLLPAVGLYINEIQQDASVCRYLITAKLLYMFRASSNPSSGVHKTVTAASGTGHITYQGNHLPPAWPSVPWHVIWPVPEAAVTVLCTPDDGCDDARNM